MIGKNPIKIYLRYAKKRGWLMTAKNELTPLERGIMIMVRSRPKQTANEIAQWFIYDTPEKVNQALSNLISNSYIAGSAGSPIRYTAVR